MSTKKASTALEVGQNLIELGLKVQRKEVPLKLIINEIDPKFIESMIQNLSEWEKDIKPKDRILAIMEIQAVSKAELAKKLGVSRQYVTDILSGKNDLSLKAVEKIAKALKIPVSGIFKI